MKEAAYKVVDIRRRKRQKKVTGWWSEKGREVVKRKKVLYKRALGEKTESAWEEYRRANKDAKKVVEEAKKEELVRFGKELQIDF